MFNNHCEMLLCQFNKNIMNIQNVTRVLIYTDIPLNFYICDQNQAKQEHSLYNLFFSIDQNIEIEVIVILTFASTIKRSFDFVYIQINPDGINMLDPRPPL